MKIFLIFFILAAVSFLSAQEVSKSDQRPKLSFSFQEFRTQGREKNPEEKNAQKVSGIAQPFFFSFVWNKQSDLFQTELELDAFSSSEKGLVLLPGKNAYLGIRAKGFLWAFGRRIDPISFPAWNFWKDGVEGAFVESLGSGIKVRFDLLDLYRGFPLRENSWLVYQGRENYLPRDASQELLPKNIPNYSYASRYRAGIQIFGEGISPWIYQFRIRYLSLGNLGKFGEETKEANTGSEDGDKDYLTEWKVGLGYVWKYFYISVDGYLSRGLEKTGSNPNRPEKSLPISGETVRFDAGVYFLKGNISIYGFLPNREKRNSNGEILELGYVGMGTSPLPNPVLNQIWGFYPSAWVTGAGLEREDTRYPGKRPSGFIGIRTEWKDWRLRLGMHITYISFFSETESSGEWALSRKIFGQSFVREAGVTLCYNPEDDSQTFLQMDLGGIQSDEEMGIKQWYLLLQLGVRWE